MTRVIFFPKSRTPGALRRAAGLVAALLLATAVRAQTVPPQQIVQVGAGVMPGVGAQVGLVAPRGFYTIESIVYVDGSPSFAGGQASIQVSGGLGGAVRIFGILRVLGSPRYNGRDIDVGLRFGPSLFFTAGGSSRGENPFSLFLDPFVRVASTLGGRRVFFAEVGLQRPILRGGLLVDL